MRPLTLISLTLGLLGIASAAKAEGGCPPGWMPYSGTNMTSCGLIPGSGQSRQQTNPQTNRQQWADRWGAIATYEPNGSLGTASQMPTQNSAEQTALEDCRSKNGSPCEIQLSYKNQCAAMIVGGKIFNVNPGATADEAAQNGLNMCRSEANDCHVYYSACSLPIRLR